MSGRRGGGKAMFFPPERPSWNCAGEEEMSAIQSWTVGGVESVPRSMYVHGETGSAFVISSILFEGSDDSLVQAKEYMASFAFARQL